MCALDASLPFPLPSLHLSRSLVGLESWMAATDPPTAEEDEVHTIWRAQIIEKPGRHDQVASCLLELIGETVFTRMNYGSRKSTREAKLDL